MNSIAAWVLIVTTHTYSGGTVSFQEFDSKEDCLFARGIAKDLSDAQSMTRATCVPKGLHAQRAKETKP